MPQTHGTPDDDTPDDHAHDARDGHAPDHGPDHADTDHRTGQTQAAVNAENEPAG